MKRMQWVALILCAAAIAINYLDRSTISIANPEIRREFNISAPEFGALQAAWSLAFAITQIPVGLLIDRIGPGMLLGFSMILEGTCPIALSRSACPWLKLENCR